jgi:cytochrome P450
VDRAPPPSGARVMPTDPVPPVLPLLGHVPWFWRDTNGFLLRLAREQGDVATFRLGRRDAFLLSHPDHVRQVLVDDAAAFRKGGIMRRARRLLGDGLLTSEGERHHAQRRALQPAFSRGQLAAYGAAVPRLAAAMSESWSNGQVVDLSAAMDQLALSVVAETLLGADAAALAADLRVLSARGPLLVAPFGHVLERLRVPPFRAAGQAADRIRSAMLDHVTSAPPAGERDVISLLHRAGPGGRMPAELARDEAMTLFLAGHDTTAAALTWTWYLLATHPAVAVRLRGELDQVLGDRDPVPDDGPSLAYSGMVFDEAIRLYPPIGRIGRRPVREYAIAGHRIPAFAPVFLSPFVTQRDPRWWPDPERFDPERWRPEADAARPRYAAFPFGAGPRSCIGGAMARMVAVLAIATIARRWTFSRLPGPTPRIRPILTLKPDRPLCLRAVRVDPTRNALDAETPRAPAASQRV